MLANSSGYGSFDIRQSAAIGGEATTGTARLTLDSSGNVGIGTSSPADLLHGYKLAQMLLVTFRHRTD